MLFRVFRGLERVEGLRGFGGLGFLGFSVTRGGMFSHTYIRRDFVVFAYLLRCCALSTYLSIFEDGY